MKRNERVICKDGFSMSVQAHDGAYCHPRIDSAEEYSEVEVGFPSERENLLQQYAECWDMPTETVYGYVPVSVVELVCAKHGGVVSGELPPGVIRLEHWS